MATPLSVEAKLVLKIMAGKEWRRREDVVNVLAPMVAPGRAVRKFDADALKPEARIGPEPTLAEKIRMGQRRIAQVTVRSMKRRFLDSVVRDDEEWLRLRESPAPAKSKVFRVPGAEPDDELDVCVVCGAFVLTSQREDHDTFHTLNDSADEPVEPPAAPGGALGQGGDAEGLPDELWVLLRQLVREELRAVLAGDEMRLALGQELKLVLGGQLLRQLIRDETEEVVESVNGDFLAGLQRSLQAWVADMERLALTGSVTRAGFPRS